MRCQLIGLPALLSSVLLVATPVAWPQQPPTLPAPPVVGPAPHPPPAQRGVEGAGAMRAAPAEGLSLVLAPVVLSTPELDKEAAGLPADSRPELLTWERVYALALVRARTDRAAFAASLDPQALAEAANRQGVADFARFRKDFLAPRTAAAALPIDPSGKFLEVQRRMLAIDHARRAVAFHENLEKLFLELVQGEAGALSRIHLDLVHSASLRSRQKLANEIGHFRDHLDELKVELGLSPRAFVVPDRKSLAAFESVFEAVDQWQRQPNRHLDDLYRRIARLPSAGDVIVNGRPLLRVIDAHPAGFEASLAMIAGVATKNRPADVAAPGAQVGRELQIRKQFRHLFQTREAYEDQKWAYESAVRLRDQAFEQLMAPGTSAAASRSPLVSAFLDHADELSKVEDRLISLWTTYRLERLAFYRELGALPYDDWNSFYGQFQATLQEPAAAAR